MYRLLILLLLSLPTWNYVLNGGGIELGQRLALLTGIQEAPPPLPVVSLVDNRVVLAGLSSYAQVAVPGIPAEDIQLSCPSINIEPASTAADNSYRLTPLAPGKHSIHIDIKGRAPQEIELFARAIFAKVRLGKIRSGDSLSLGTLKAQRGLIPWIENFDISAKGRMLGFKIRLIPKRGNIRDFYNEGGAFGPTALKMIGKEVASGDRLIFYDLRYRLPASSVLRHPALHFFIETV